MSDETPEERQNNEFEVLKAIFGDDLVDNRAANAWKIWRPLDLNLTLNPLHSSTTNGVHCSVTLHIMCCPNYPEKPPTVGITKLRGLSNENGIKILEEIRDQSVQLCGEVMIYELAQTVQTFLHNHNRPTSKSFYDEMLQNQNELKRIKLEDIKSKENIERQKIHDEVLRRKEILKAEGRYQRVPRISISQDSVEVETESELVCYAENKVPSPNYGRQSAQVKDEKPACTCGTTSFRTLKLTTGNIRKINIGKCIGHSSRGSITFAGIDTENGELLLVRKWCLTGDTTMLTRNLNLLEQEMTQIFQLRHNSLVPYTSMDVQYSNSSPPTVHAVREFLIGYSIKQLLNNRKSCEISENLTLLRQVAFGVLNGLRVIHSSNYVHRDVRAENVFLDNAGIVKLTSIALDVRLLNLRDASLLKSYTWKRDVFCTGIMLLSIISDEQMDVSQPEIPSQIPSMAKDFLSKCLAVNDDTQWTVEQLLNHRFLTQTSITESVFRDPDDGYSGSEEDLKPAMTCMKAFYEFPRSRHSRINEEFEVLKWLGRGAYGDVMKVRNKLDGGFYAIKCIELNPESKQLNKKITREVKLLSRLNHENVVRYYNAWIETVETPLISDQQNNDPSMSGPDGDSTEEAVAKLAPNVHVEWSISDAPALEQSRTSSTISTSDSEDEDDGWFKFLPESDTNHESDSDSIEFESSEQKTGAKSTDSRQKDTSRPQTALLHQILYIQMEFCEKNTLRHAIDSGLYMEKIRAWRLFRETVQGLAHVHQSGMIHRDLKPVNIFLDSNDHVKIGDFGLATKVFATPTVHADGDKAKDAEDLTGSLTGQVGTALYVAPELLVATNKVIYNQKVDIYSLGIILFEMFCPPLQTGMERIKVLTELRTKDVKLPEKFLVPDNNKLIHVIRWLLKHEASARPSCAEILASEHVPRALPEGALSGLLAHTLRDRHTKTYRRLVSACLDQHFTPAEDLTYDSGVRIVRDDALIATRDAVISVFQRHGALEFSPPLLVPRTQAWESAPNTVRLMTAFGGVVSLPHDLRVPFARHVAYGDVKCMRRYAVERVFREKHVPGFHPRELLECAFDIVAPKPVNMWADAELIVVACSAIQEAGSKMVLQINHTSILRGVLRGCGIPLDRHAELYPILVDVRCGRLSKFQLATHLTSLCLPPRATAQLLRLMEAGVPMSRAGGVLAPMVRKRGELGRAVETGLKELEMVVANAIALGADCPIMVVPCLAYNAAQQEGILWQAIRATDQSKAPQGKIHSADLLAVGGRYDILVEQFKQITTIRKDDSDLKVSALGLSLSLERLAAIARKATSEEGKTGLVTTLKGQPRVCVCLWGTAKGGRNSRASALRAQLAKDLWTSGLSVVTSECKTAVEAHELTSTSIVLVVEDDHCGTVRVTSWDKDRVTERRIGLTEVVDTIKQRLQPEAVRSPENSVTARVMNWNDNCERSTAPPVTVTIVSQDRISSANKRRIESQALSAANSTLTGLGIKRRVAILALGADGALVRALAANLDATLASCDLAKVFDTVREIFPRQRHLLDEAEDAALTIMNTKFCAGESPLFAVYSCVDNIFRLVT